MLSGDVCWFKVVFTNVSLLFFNSCMLPQKWVVWLFCWGYAINLLMRLEGVE